MRLLEDDDNDDGGGNGDGGEGGGSSGRGLGDEDGDNNHNNDTCNNHKIPAASEACFLLSCRGRILQERSHAALNLSLP